jgi:hypothetical protein
MHNSVAFRSAFRFVVLRSGSSQVIEIQRKRSGSRSGAFRCVPVFWKPLETLGKVRCVPVRSGSPLVLPPLKGGIEHPPSALRSGLVGRAPRQEAWQ